MHSTRLLESCHNVCISSQKTHLYIENKAVHHQLSRLLLFMKCLFHKLSVVSRSVKGQLAELKKADRRRGRQAAGWLLLKLPSVFLQFL